MKKMLFALLAGLSLNAFAVVNLNTATQAELEALNGVGPVKAKAILEYRSKNGPFKSVDDLDKVSGFGKATLDKLRSELTVAGAAAGKPAAPAAAKPADKKPAEKKQ